MIKWGQGSLILNDASTYHGGFVNNVFHGKDTLCERDGRTYVGDWKDGERHGEGIEIFADGRVYMGGYKDGLRHCEVGTMLERSGGRVIYRGTWNQGQYHGEGMLVHRLFADPADVAAGTVDPSLQANCRGGECGKVVQFEGSFVGGQLYGYGMLKNEADGVTYKGKWDKNRPVSGKWRVIFHDGSIYSGAAKLTGPPSTVANLSLEDGLSEDDEMQQASLLSIHESAGLLKPDGFGTLKYASRDVYVGTFIEGKRDGNGQCVFANGDRWDGDWEDDKLKMDGNGQLTLAGGTIQRYNSKESA